jgi:Domain of unknown function (DUF4157)
MAEQAVATQTKAATSAAQSNQAQIRTCSCGKHVTPGGGECEQCRRAREQGVHRSVVARTPQGDAPPALRTVIQKDGDPLDMHARAVMEAHFRRDFSGVRVHTDAAAAASAREVDAAAYTVGRHVVFAAPAAARTEPLLAHELVHVVQQEGRPAPPTSAPLRIASTDHPAEREAERAVAEPTARISPVGRVAVQRSVWGAITGALGSAWSAITGVLGSAWEAVTRFFGGGTFSDAELGRYLRFLDTNRRIEGHYDSDNKAREVVGRWKAGQPSFAVLPVPIRTLLIQEMLSGYVSGADEDAILALLEEAVVGEQRAILGAVGAGRLRSSFSGDNLRQLNDLLELNATESELARRTSWTADGVMRILGRQGDERTIATIVDEGYKIISFTTAFDKWRYDDGRVEEEEVTTLKGNTCRVAEAGVCAAHEIRLRESLTDEAAAATLFHEVQHVVLGQTTTHTAGLEQEIEARVRTEHFRIRHGMPPARPNYRKPDGTVDVDAIRKSIIGSPHYDPTGRERIRRRYVGERVVPGWHKAAPKAKAKP